MNSSPFKYFISCSKQKSNNKTKFYIYKFFRTVVKYFQTFQRTKENFKILIPWNFHSVNSLEFSNKQTVHYIYSHLNYARSVQGTRQKTPTRKNKKPKHKADENNNEPWRFIALLPKVERKWQMFPFIRKHTHTHFFHGGKATGSILICLEFGLLPNGGKSRARCSRIVDGFIFIASQMGLGHSSFTTPILPLVRIVRKIVPKVGKSRWISWKNTQRTARALFITHLYAVCQMLNLIKSNDSHW